MRLPSTDRAAIDRLKNHFLGKRIPGAGTWGEQDALRGWKDDFLGDIIHEQYTESSVGAGTGSQLQPNAHGGWFNMWTGAVALNDRKLWLGNAADGFATLDADQGWLMLLRAYWTAGANTVGYFGAKDAAENNVIWAGNRVGTWTLETRTGGGAWNTVGDGAADGNTHWFGLCAYPFAGGRQADFFLDGSLIVSTAVSVPTICLTPFLMIRTTGAVNLNMLTDFWGVMPKNLA